MREISKTNSSATQIMLIRKYLKLKILDDNITFRNHCEERNHVYDLMKRSVSHGESHSALMIGPRGSGKTTLINSVLNQLSKEVDLENDAVIVKLNGLVHHDEKIALKSITAQMQLENSVGDRVFGTFAENLAFLLSCLQSGSDRCCKSMVFILDEFDIFCHSGKTQTLLYNLFDITHSKQAPACVIGITNRIDVMELLEKRVKSRFSHRHIFLFPNQGPAGSRTRCQRDYYLGLLVELLSVPVVKKSKKRKSVAIAQEAMETVQPQPLPIEIVTRHNVVLPDASFVEDWNAHVSSLVVDEKLVDGLEKLSYYSVNEQVFRNILFQEVSKLSTNRPFISVAEFCSTIDNTVAPEHRVKLLHSLSILELSLVIAMMHGVEIFDGQPMNFEMVLHRYTKFATANSSTQTVPRPVILKAFEHLQSLEIILPVRTDSAADSTTSTVQREYKLFSLATPASEVKEAVRTAKALPTETQQWACSSVF